MKLQTILGSLLLCTTMVGCSTQSLMSEFDAKHIEVTNNGLVIPLGPAPGSAAFVIGNQRISIDSVPVYTITGNGDSVTQFQSTYEEWEGGARTIKSVDTISFCNDTALAAGGTASGGDATTTARTSSGNAASDRCAPPE